MALIIKSVANFYNALFGELRDTRSDNYPIIAGPPTTLILIIAAYAVLCRYGPVLMKTRKPFDLTTIMTIYNLIQVIGCTISGVIAIYYVFWRKKYNFACQEIDYSQSELGIAESRLTYLYFGFKVIDLLDTVFIVLKKKEAQLTFLHCYHHGGMVILIYASVKWLPGGHGSVLGIINTFVHSIMYFYYYISAFKPELKKSIWWKKHITQIQLIQFAILVFHFFRVLWAEHCSFPKFVSILVGAQNLFMFMMFADFYYKVYVKVRKHNKDKK